MDFATVKRGEVLRYMGCKGEVPPEVLNLAEECLAMHCSCPEEELYSENKQ